jgi:hypothetical protein
MWFGNQFLKIFFFLAIKGILSKCNAKFITIALIFLISKQTALYFMQHRVQQGNLTFSLFILIQKPPGFLAYIV